MLKPKIRMKTKTSPSAWLLTTFTATAFLLFGDSSLKGQTWIGPSGTGDAGSWATDSNWNPATRPNSAGAAAIFNNPPATRAITVDSGATGFIVGSISFDNTSSTTNNTSVNTGTTGSKLILDNSGSEAAITTTGNGPGNNTIQSPLVLSNSLTATVNQTTSISGSGSLNLTAVISGPGGFTKSGDGLATFGTGAKTYTGPTVLGGGRLRISSAASPNATASFTINGGQLTLISAANYTFGSGPLNLNGAGPITGPFAAFPGAIRPDTGLAIAINNAVVLQSDAMIHVQGSASGSLTLPNAVSGPGKLTFTSPAHDANLGVLVLGGANTYAGGTLIDGGTLVVSNAAGSLGTGNVTVKSANLVFAGASAKLKIQAAVTNAIADAATLSLAGGNVAGVADDGSVELESGVNEVVGGLVLGGVTQGSGTYGSTASSAAIQNDEFFAGPGIVTVVAPTAPPLLQITLSVPDVIISWPTNAAGFVLQELSDLTATNWMAVTNSIVVSGTNNTVTKNASSGTDFFRLRN
jgi:fibronectin-binding autotransporter adhesin